MCAFKAHPNTGPRSGAAPGLHICNGVQKCAVAREAFIPSRPLFANEGRVSGLLPAVSELCGFGAAADSPRLRPSVRSERRGQAPRFVSSGEKRVSTANVCTRLQKKRKNICVGQAGCLPAALYDSVVTFVKLGVTSGTTC